MTALHAAGGGLPLAVHLPHVLEQIGSLAGFAAIAGLAVLSALYFSQARDVKRLREWAGRAPERAAEAAQEGQASTAAAVPGRVVPVPQPTPQAVKAPAPGATASAAAGGAAGAAAGATTAEAEKTAAPGANGQKPEEEQKAEEQKAEEEKAEEQKAEGAPQDGDAAAKDGDDAGDGSAPAPGKPGMPAPASAAAAAGAGAASVAGPAAPAGQAAAAPAGQAAVAGAPAAAAAPAATPGAPPRPATGPGVPPARPPTSVLPPRTGAAPPVRRIGGTAAGNPAFGPPPADTPVKRNPVYIALAVAGVLVLGAGAAIGVPKLVSGGSSDNSPAKKHAAAKKAAAQRPPLVPAKITVSVLNGTTVPGLAAQIGDQVQSDGFNLGNTAQVAGILEGTKAQQANSIVMYASGHAREARFVAKRLHLTGGVEAIDQNSRQLAGDATVVVVAGEDQAH